jgi:hypothetical protein
LDFRGKTELRLIDCQGHSIRIMARGVTLIAASEETHLESFPGNGA